MTFRLLLGTALNAGDCPNTYPGPHACFSLKKTLDSKTMLITNLINHVTSTNLNAFSLNLSPRKFYSRDPDDTADILTGNEVLIDRTLVVTSLEEMLKNSLHIH